MKNPFRRKPPMPSNRYVLGEEVIHPGKYVSIPRSAHLAILGESNSGTRCLFRSATPLLVL